MQAQLHRPPAHVTVGLKGLDAPSTFRQVLPRLSASQSFPDASTRSLRLSRISDRNPLTDSCTSPPARCRPIRTHSLRESLASAPPGGADRVRTGDPLLAKQVLSQLSYSPIDRYPRPPFPQAIVWWVWVDSNHRPHPYQGCALTT